ncbi:hypothetical protein V2J09_009348 [Rumex salicifolius]
MLRNPLRQFSNPLPRMNRLKKHKGVHNGNVKSCWKTKGTKFFLSLSTPFTQFKCVEEEDRVQRDKTESVHFASSSQNNGLNKARDAARKHL